MSKKYPAITVLILAAGSGERFGGNVPKQYQPLMGKPVVRWSMETFQTHPMISSVHVMVHPDHANDFKTPLPGGNDRQSSVRKGLEAIRASKPDFVLIHDAARPLVSASLITAVCNAAIESGAAIPGIPVTDTVRRNGKTENRENLYIVQTPQAFRFEMIDALHQKYRDKSFTDDATLCDAEGHPVTIVPGRRDNLKITHPEDMALAEQYLFSRCGDARTAQGYDVHRLVQPASPAKKLMLCGVAIPHDKVLEGHSDADVGLHALTDAILGAICDGDIGQHFSPQDPRWKNADSAVFLKHAAEQVMKRGGVITHADVTLVCESPRIAPYRNAMRQRIADLLHLPLSRISVKATTTEGLGFTGRGEGIAAQSVVTIRLPFEDEKKWAA